MAKRLPKQYRNEDPLIEWLAWLMDESIRIGPWSVGLDGFLGLIPGFGDMAGSAVSALIIARAMQSGIPKSAVIRMVINVGLDSLVGAVPFLGDIFDFAFKSNTYNLQIYREALRQERQPVRDWLFITFVVLTLVAIVVLPILGLVYLTKILITYIR
jgi:NAD/NADP transhydrogenase beta subunit